MNESVSFKTSGGYTGVKYIQRGKPMWFGVESKRVTHCSVVPGSRALPVWN